VAVASRWLARDGGKLVLRVEDIDTPRVVAGSAARIEEDLRWLGIEWDEGPFYQSERTAHYDAALAELSARGLVYPCDCSRAEIARSASAPHAGEEIIYPGLCRDLDPARVMKREPALRLRVPRERITVEDGVVGTIEQDLEAAVGDFVLRRGDGVYAYQLAVVVDDLAMGITDVVRGADLVSSTPRQVLVARLLGQAPPRYHHLPLVLDAHGERLAKRTPGAHVRALREAGISAEEIVSRLTIALGLNDGRLAPSGSFRIPSEWTG
jgi:glutamyl-tRNA synthetase